MCKKLRNRSQKELPVLQLYFSESMASANALMHHRRLQRVKKTSHSDRPEANNSAAGSAEVRIVPVEDSSDSGRALFHRIC